jgi:hypothetical protein
MAISKERVLALLDICKEVDGDDYGSITAFLEAATVDIVEELCESYLESRHFEEQAQAGEWDAFGPPGMMGN